MKRTTLKEAIAEIEETNTPMHPKDRIQLAIELIKARAAEEFVAQFSMKLFR